MLHTVEGITRGEGTLQRPRKQLDLPVLPSMMQQRNQDGGEFESRLQEEIMKMNGILSINGKVCCCYRFQTLANLDRL
jgi:hypothetical protein